MYFAIKSEHEYPTISFAAGLKKVTGTVADGSAMKPLKLYLHVSSSEMIRVLLMFYLVF